MSAVADVDDGYDAYYAERLWQLLPAVYRTADTDSFDAPGPLRELLDRIGAQVAVVRRSIDRLWADQSIETCDDWVIPYIGDLLGTNLVNNLDARAQRLDVAKTIHYRRRKGTLEVLEELARDVTGWTAHVVEGFRRLARTRHGLDPAVGPAAFPRASPADVAQLLQIEGLTGLLTGAPAGGFADLRSRHGAALADTAFDESFHTADVRAGRGAVGHFGIPKLVVFLWRLTSFAVVGGTPVAVAGCPTSTCSTRPAARSRSSSPGARARRLLRVLDVGPRVAGPRPADELPRDRDHRHRSVPAAAAGALSRRRPSRPAIASAEGWQLTSIWPETGRFAAAPATPAGPLTVDYQYGFPSMIGAGPYDRALLGDPPGRRRHRDGRDGGTGLDAALAAAGATGTVTVGDVPRRPTPSPTRAGRRRLDAEPIVSLLVRGRPGHAPGPAAGGRSGAVGLHRGRPAGAQVEAQLVLDGLTVSGCDIVLRGAFDTVRITACTVDPGTAGTGLAAARDGGRRHPARAEPDLHRGRSRRPAGRRRSDRPAPRGPLHPRPDPHAARRVGRDADDHRQHRPGPAGDGRDRLHRGGRLRPAPAGQGPPRDRPAVAGAARGDAGRRPRPHCRRTRPSRWRARSRRLPRGPRRARTRSSTGRRIYDAALFATVELSPDVLALAEAGPLDPAQLAALNRGLLDESFPVALGVAALAVADATVQLTRVTVLGRIAAHRLSASDSILADFAAVDDVQDGCVRFSAYAGGSAIPRQYQSAAIPPGAPIFTSTRYGQPGYAQLLETADAAIVGGAAGASHLLGRRERLRDGRVLRDLDPVKEQGLLIKYAEYMPLGLTPVIVHVT